MRICAYDGRQDSPARGKLVEIVASAHKPRVVTIPGIYWHGTKTVGSEPSLTVYLVTKLCDYHSSDEERCPWNDPTIIGPGQGSHLTATSRLTNRSQEVT